ncbi:MAG: hypothetical protein N2C14_09105 [Planctomycetales bacterium]
MTFKDRVTRFWDWYPEVADRFFETIQEGRCEELAPEVSEFMGTNLPGLGWVFGPGENGGHSFTVTGGGVVAMQMLAHYWRQGAPRIPNWTFHASRQPSDAEKLSDFAISLGDQEQVDMETFLLKTTVDEEAKSLHLVAWHPALEQVPDEHHFQILFLLLDEALGEFGTQTWLGEIKIEPFARDDETKRLVDLPAFLRQVNGYYQWDKPSPLETYSLYKLPNPTDARRGDTIVGTTCVPDLLFEFLEHGGKIPEDPLEGTGAEFAYLAVNGAVFPEDKQSDVRGEIEDALTAALENERGGRVLGGAFGARESYIDLLLFDGDASRQTIQRTLTARQLDGLSRIETFV